MSRTATATRRTAPRERRQLHGRHGVRQAPQRPPVRRSTLLALTVGALGVVVGDIGTSLPLERTVVMGSQIPL